MLRLCVRRQKSAMSCHGGVATTPTAGTITGLRTVTCLRMARRPRPAPARPRAVTPGAAVRRTDKRGADRGAFRTRPPPRSVPFRNAQSAVRTATSSAAVPPSTIITKRKRPCSAVRIADGRLPWLNARALGRLRPSLTGYGVSRLRKCNPTSGRLTRLRLVSPGWLVSNKIACPDGVKPTGRIHENRDRILRPMRL